jgi:penicillin-binding protein 2
MYDAINDASVNYSVYKQFMDLNVTVAGKTGTAQVSPLQSHNSLMTTFAPFDDPELVVTCVLEKGNSGSNCGRAISGVYRYVYGSVEQ